MGTVWFLPGFRKRSDFEVNLKEEVDLTGYHALRQAEKNSNSLMQKHCNMEFEQEWIIKKILFSPYFFSSISQLKRNEDNKK